MHARRWFRSTVLREQPLPLGGDWCGEIDAAPYMPADIFQPENFLSLLAYAQLTIRTYVNPNDAATPAFGESSVILLHPPLRLVGVSIVMESECQQNDRTLVNG